MWTRPNLLAITLALIIGASALAADSETVSLQTRDGVWLTADYYPPVEGTRSAPMAVLLHMYRSDRSAWAPLTEPLRQAGFATLAIDLRGHGESSTPELEKRVQDRDPQIFKDMYDDVRGAYDWLAQQENVDRSRFAIVGASVGCSIALRYAVQDKSVDVVVCMTPGLKYLGLDSAADMEKLRGRQILLLATENEREAADKLRPLAKGTQAKVYKDQKAHGTHMFGSVDGVERDIVDFLKRGVGEPVAEPCFGSINSNIYHLPGSGWFDRIKPTNLRYYSSAEEAEQRGLRVSKTRSPRPERSDDRRGGGRPKGPGAPTAWLRQTVPPPPSVTSA